MPNFLQNIEKEYKSKGSSLQPAEVRFTSLEIITMKRNGTNSAGTKLQVEVSMPGLARVSSYTRIQNGKPVKVRSYYRRSWTADVVSVRISTR